MLLLVVENGDHYTQMFTKRTERTTRADFAIVRLRSTGHGRTGARLPSRRFYTPARPQPGSCSSAGLIWAQIGASGLWT